MMQTGTMAHIVKIFLVMNTCTKGPVIQDSRDLLSYAKRKHGDYFVVPLHL